MSGEEQRITDWRGILRANDPALAAAPAPVQGSDELRDEIERWLDKLAADLDAWSNVGIAATVRVDTLLALPWMQRLLAAEAEQRALREEYYQAGYRKGYAHADNGRDPIY